ncbi:type III pantothenate kinase [Halopseudomonas yangmingensis]|uniref:Type III pantothenate kinase n=1 Tax=Halopseudomonas yangmingensis TaxID=1720063 RepID=A0A1I4TTL9_9GAMM|nr:type III pantothenate kinase [Halopseudomonas yangmingensis]SFM79925.1 type III pantothenate kinase [Halopseudomonas yangmingensis]
MLLELDCGNTLIKWRLIDSGGRVRDRDMSPDLVDLQCLLGAQERDIHACRLVSVRSEDETRRLLDQLASWLHIKPALAGSARVLAGVSNGYKDYRQLGMDRWLALVAAYNKTGMATLVMDLGTAITVDYVRSCGQHLGGFIAPGRRLLRSSLKQHTRLIRYSDLDARVNLETPGGSTGEAVEHGCDLMVLGFVNAQILNARKILGEQAVVVLTGGDAPLIASMLDKQVVLAPDLVFDGLALACPVGR